MTGTLFAFAPAGSLGTGSVDARPYACTAVRPELPGAVLGAAAVAQGSGLPTSGLSIVGQPAAGMAPLFRDRAGWVTGTAAALGMRPQIDAITTHDEFTKNDGTTLGIHSPGRPLS